MQNHEKHLNPQISVDCVVFGFDGVNLKVLLIKQNNSGSKTTASSKHKLPGDLIIRMEDLDTAAKRVLKELTGLEDIFLKQFSVFGKPDRFKDEHEIKWLEESAGVSISRVITTAYFSLIRIDDSKKENAISSNASWQDIDSLPPLVFDHSDIIQKGIEHLRKEIRDEPICFELLPEKFTIRQIQTLYEAIIGGELDNRNFRKKLLKANYVIALNEKEKGVAHKPAMFYHFDHEKYNQSKKELLNYNF